MAEDTERSLAQRAADNGHDPDDMPDEFPQGVIEPSAAKKLGQLIRAGLPVELSVSMMSASIPLRGGLPDPEKQHRFVVTTQFHKAEPVAVWEDGLLASWKVRVHLRPVYVEAVDDAT
jgi:hypothetical protein